MLPEADRKKSRQDSQVQFLVPDNVPGAFAGDVFHLDQPTDIEIQILAGTKDFKVDFLHGMLLLLSAASYGRTVRTLQFT